ncbi:hypothetical protein MKY34_17985 [Sporosarcina sp. FSL K6-1522]|uniref:hypothetical protein n=1 Tax=Sporosarcina sp. FSL K6-1522 TaxID=2921554 RepID=UPI00315B0FDE
MRLEQGWVKLHRELLDKPIWTEATPEQKVLLITLLMMANHSEKQWEWKGERFTARPGQCITSLPALVQKCGKNSSIQKVRTALKRFAKYEFLTDESTAHNRLITIINWGVYQGKEEATTDRETDGQQTTNRQVTANKNEKNEKNEKNSTCRKQVYDEASLFYQLALSFYEQVSRNHPGIKEPNLQKWANDFRLLVEQDQWTIEQITYVMTWSQQHAFWHTVVLSPASIRRNWTRMVAQVKQERTSAKGQVQKKYVEEFTLDLAKGEDL